MAGSKLTNMKTTAAEMKARQEKYSGSSIATDGPSYPYGLSINLDDESLDKLDLDLKDLSVGGELVLVAKVRVSSVSSNQSDGGPSRKSCSLQITEMCLEPEGAKAGDAAEALYT